MQQQFDQGTKDRSDRHGIPDHSDDRSRAGSINITSHNNNNDPHLNFQ